MMSAACLDSFSPKSSTAHNTFHPTKGPPFSASFSQAFIANSPYFPHPFSAFHFTHDAKKIDVIFNVIRKNLRFGGGTRRKPATGGVSSSIVYEKTERHAEAGRVGCQHVELVIIAKVRRSHLAVVVPLRMGAMHVELSGQNNLGPGLGKLVRARKASIKYMCAMDICTGITSAAGICTEGA